MIQPSEIFPDFPDIKWEMGVQEARKAIEKTGAHPVTRRYTRTEMAWDGTFNGMNGRAAILFTESGGIHEIAVIVHAADRRKELFEQLLAKIDSKHGGAKEEEETSIDTSKVWRLKNGFVIELRLIKDDDSPVVLLHWVRSWRRRYEPTLRRARLSSFGQVRRRAWDGCPAATLPDTPCRSKSSTVARTSRDTRLS